MAAEEAQKIMTQDQVKEMLLHNPLLNEEKLVKRVESIDSLIWFYEKKLADPEIEDRFIDKFKRFISALHYSKTIIIKHQQLIKDLQRIDIELNKQIR
jgi:hypothetical protein